MVRTPIQSHLAREEVAVSINVPFLYVIMPYADLSGEGGGGESNTVKIKIVSITSNIGRCTCIIYFYWMYTPVHLCYDIRCKPHSQQLFHRSH